ncbi:uncharacterized protein LOC113147473 [Cyclospora cayetanensis]|uniref:Uncharacterized protein LOC113147473 n=1 Tax=Cyclospora cayetanensis TaxID=88456 RepID=A0A6P6S1H4_9EIME|nr:uncharacterized protein LOC113147473 [Cyclospora cayetanensis]
MAHQLLPPQDLSSAADLRRSGWAPPPAIAGTLQRQRQQQQQQLLLQQRHQSLHWALRAILWWYELPLCRRRQREEQHLEQQQERQCSWLGCARWSRLWLAADCLLLLLVSCTLLAATLFGWCWLGEYRSLQRYVYEASGIPLRASPRGVLTLLVMLTLHAFFLLGSHLVLRSMGMLPQLANVHEAFLAIVGAAAAAAGALVAELSPRHYAGFTMWLQLYLPLFHGALTPVASVALCCILRRAQSVLQAAGSQAPTGASDEEVPVAQGVPLLICGEDSSAEGAAADADRDYSGTSQPAATAAAAAPLPVFGSVVVRERPPSLQMRPLPFSRSSGENGATRGRQGRRRLSLSCIRVWAVILLSVCLWLLLLVFPFLGPGAFGSPCVFSRPPPLNSTRNLAKKIHNTKLAKVAFEALPPSTSRRQQSADAHGANPLPAAALEAQTHAAASQEETPEDACTGAPWLPPRPLAGAVGFSADVHITANHVPFLFRDIYGTVSSIDQKMRDAIAQARIARLSDLLALAVSWKSPILVSVQCPPCSLNAFDCGDSCPLLIFDAVKKAKAEQFLWWQGAMRDEVRRSLPLARLVTEIDAAFEDDPMHMTDIVSAPWTDLEASRVRALAEKAFVLSSKEKQVLSVILIRNNAQHNSSFKTRPDSSGHAETSKTATFGTIQQVEEIKKLIGEFINLLA